MTILSVYLSNHHDYPTTWDYLKRLQPAWVRIHQADARAVARVQEVCPGAKLMLRSWDIDDSNNERKRELYSNPKQAAKDTIARWAVKLGEIEEELHRNGWGYNPERWYLGLWNEPDPAYLAQVVEATAEAMRISPYRLGVLCASVGNFGKPGENNSWTLCKSLEQPIKAGGHVLIAHEYWQPEGPSAVWVDEKGSQRHDAGNLAWRHQHIPLDVPILIGESGANGYIYGRHTQQDNGGWQKYMKPEQYAAQVREYIEGCDNRVEGVCLYMTDYHSDQWKSFDTTPAHEQLLAVKDVKPMKVYVPIVGGGPTQPKPQQPAPRALAWPCAGVVTQRFGENPANYARFGLPGHNGLDIGAPQGTSIRAVAEGEVVWVDTDPDYGNYVRVYHQALGFHSFYAHLSSAGCTVGQHVKRGQEIGKMGSTGNSTGPHLHLEIRLGNRDSYGQATFGHSKGRVDPETVYGVLGKI